VNLLVIKDSLPEVMTVTDVIKHHAKQLVNILTRELELEKRELLDKLHQRTLERFFIEERLYKAIEKMKSAEGVVKAVIDGFAPFLKEVGSRGVSEEDVDRLLKIPIRRISLYDINRAKAEMLEIQARIKEIKNHLKNIVAYAVGFLEGIIARIRADEEVGRGARKTQVEAFEKVDVKEVVKRDVELRYDRETGYLGSAVSGETLAELSPFDRILTLRENGVYSVTDIPEKAFVGPRAWWIGPADKEALASLVFTVIYREAETGYPCIKRCIIEGWIMNKEYSLVPEGARVLHIDTRPEFAFTVYYASKPRIKIAKEVFKAQDYAVRGLKAGGIRLAVRDADRVEVSANKEQRTRNKNE
jgi:topoisomerase-4 subunit A